VKSSVNVIDQPQVPWHTPIVKPLKYIELKSGYEENGPALIGYVTPSKNGSPEYATGLSHPLCLQNRFLRWPDFTDVNEKVLN